MTLGNLILIAVLAGSPDVEALRRELDGVAERIEQLKARAQAGEQVEGELEPLLVRSQELAEQLEQALPQSPTPPPAQESADAARERADELRGEAAALRGQVQQAKAALSAVEARIAEALRAATSRQEPAIAPAGFAHSSGARSTPRTSEPAPGAAAALGPLVEERARLEARIEALGAEAARLMAEANALDGE